MDKLSDSQMRCLEAAQGWLMLGCSDDARKELNQLPTEARNAAEVIELEWQLGRVGKDWEGAREAAQRLVARYPDHPSGWIYLAYAQRRLPAYGVARARETLLSARKRFPEEPFIPYNLACYAAVEGRLEEAWEWWQQAWRLAGGPSLRKLALADEDLAALHERIRQTPTR